MPANYDWAGSGIDRSKWDDQLRKYEEERRQGMAKEFRRDPRAYARGQQLKPLRRIRGGEEEPSPYDGRDAIDKGRDDLFYKWKPKPELPFDPFNPDNTFNGGKGGPGEFPAKRDWWGDPDIWEKLTKGYGGGGGNPYVRPGYDPDNPPRRPPEDYDPPQPSEGPAGGFGGVGLGPGKSPDVITKPGSGFERPGVKVEKIGVPGKNPFPGGPPKPQPKPGSSFLDMIKMQKSGA